MFPSEAIAYIILGQEDVRDPRVEVWFMAPHPHNLRGGESGQDGIPGELDHPFGTDPLGDPRALLGGALVVPQNCGPENTTSPIQRHEPMHLPGQPYGCDVTLPNAYLVQNPTYAGDRRLPPRGGILLGPSWAGREQRVFGRGNRCDLPGRVEEHGLRTRGPDVDSQQQGAAGRPRAHRGCAHNRGNLSRG